MANHNFICDACGITNCDTSAKKTHYCSQCGGVMRWDMKICIHGNYKHPVHSDSLAISPSQRAEHEKMFPDIELDKQCRPIFDNFQRHEAYLKKTGFVKSPKKTKTLGRKKLVIK